MSNDSKAAGKGPAARQPAQRTDALAPTIQAPRGAFGQPEQERRRGEETATGKAAAGATLKKPARVEVGGQVIAEDHRIGMKVGNWEIIERLGHGGMGEVYVAVHGILKRRDVVKFVKPEAVSGSDGSAKSARKRLQTALVLEAQVALGLTHENIVRAFDVGTTKDGDVFIAMEYVDGKGLRDLIDDAKENAARIHPSMAVDIAIQICGALGFAHGKETLHRDLKPENIMLVPQEGGRGHLVKVLDFGLAKKMTGGSAHTTSITGTMPYLAKEQCDGAALTAATDVYAVGLMLYEMLTGARHFNQYKNFGLVVQAKQKPLDKLMREDPKHFPPLPGGISKKLARIIHQTNSPDPDERPKTMGELAGLLARSSRLSPRAGPLIAIGALAIAAGVGVVGVYGAGRYGLIGVPWVSGPHTAPPISAPTTDRGSDKPSARGEESPARRTAKPAASQAPAQIRPKPDAGAARPIRPKHRNAGQGNSKAGPAGAEGKEDVGNPDDTVDVDLNR